MLARFDSEGIRIELFSGCTTMVKDEVNDFLKEHEGSIMDIQLGSNDKSFDILVVYRETED